MIKERVRSIVILIMMCFLCFIRSFTLLAGVFCCYHLATDMKENKEIFLLFLSWGLAIIFFALLLYFFLKDFENFKEFCESFIEDNKRKEKEQQLFEIKKRLNKNFKLASYEPKGNPDIIMNLFWDVNEKENLISLYAKIDEENNICYVFKDGHGALLSEEVKSNDYTFFLENIYV